MRKFNSLYANRLKINFLLISQLVYFTFILHILSTNLAKCQSKSSTTSVSLEYDGIFGIGWGVFAIILGMIVGILCCIFGRSTVNPGLYISIGFCIPTVMFIFMAFAPLTQPGNVNLKDNQATNSLVIVKWLFFSVMLCGLVFLLITLLGMWSSMIIPQRVDSRAQKEYFEKYEKLSLEERKIHNQNLNDKKIPGKIINFIENENDARIIVKEIKNSVFNNFNPDENIALTNVKENKNNLNDKKKNFLGGMLRRRRNDDN